MCRCLSYEINSSWVFASILQTERPEGSAGEPAPKNAIVVPLTDLVGTNCGLLRRGTGWRNRQCRGCDCRYERKYGRSADLGASSHCVPHSMGTTRGGPQPPRMTVLARHQRRYDVMCGFPKRLKALRRLLSVTTLHECRDASIASVNGMLSLGALLNALPCCTSPDAATVLSALAACGGRVGSMTFLARRLGLRNRFQLVRLLHRTGLPPLVELAGWVRVIDWLVQAEQSGASLLAIAVQEHLCALTCYRTVKRVTGVTWRLAQRRGVAWALLQLADRCERRNDTASMGRSNDARR